MNERTPKPNLSFRAKPEDAEELKALAERDDRTVSAIVAKLVSDALAARRSTTTEQRSAAA